MTIENVSIIGLGALGTLFANHLSKHMNREQLRIIADSDRIARYERDGVFSNGERCDFHYVTPDSQVEPADLLLIAVKFNGLDNAIKDVKNHVRENTIILSLLNGITSESIIAEAYGEQHMLACVAQGMDAVKIGNTLKYTNMGMICFGDLMPGEISDKTKMVASFFEKMELPFLVDMDMQKRLWGKFMLNVGINQSVAVFETNYGGVQQDGKARDTMIQAMREVVLISEKEGVFLTEKDIEYWLGIIRPLNPDNKPSLRQDVEAKRITEVELFAGTVIRLGKKHGIPTPVNQFLYEQIKLTEEAYHIGKSVQNG